MVTSQTATTVERECAELTANMTNWGSIDNWATYLEIMPGYMLRGFMNRDFAGASKDFTESQDLTDYWWAGISSSQCIQTTGKYFNVEG